MSRRFGRNQRRRAREKIEELEGARKDIEGRLNFERRKHENLNHFFDMVVKEVGYQSILAGEPNRIDHFYDGMRTIRPSPPISQLCHEGPEVYYDALAYETLRLLNIEVIRDRMKSFIHFRATLANGEVGYVLSEEAIFNMNPENLVKQITKELSGQMAYRLVKHLRPSSSF